MQKKVLVLGIILLILILTLTSCSKQSVTGAFSFLRPSTSQVTTIPTNNFLSNLFKSSNVASNSVDALPSTNLKSNDLVKALALYYAKKTKVCDVNNICIDNKSLFSQDVYLLVQGDISKTPWKKYAEAGVQPFSLLKGKTGSFVIGVYGSKLSNLVKGEELKLWTQIPGVSSVDFTSQVSSLLNPTDKKNDKCKQGLNNKLDSNPLVARQSLIGDSASSVRNQVGVLINAHGSARVSDAEVTSKDISVDTTDPETITSGDTTITTSSTTVKDSQGTSITLETKILEKAQITGNGGTLYVETTASVTHNSDGTITVSDPSSTMNVIDKNGKYYDVVKVAKADGTFISTPISVSGSVLRSAGPGNTYTPKQAQDLANQLTGKRLCDDCEYTGPVPNGVSTNIPGIYYKSILKKDPKAVINYNLGLVILPKDDGSVSGPAIVSFTKPGAGGDPIDEAGVTNGLVSDPCGNKFPNTNPARVAIQRVLANLRNVVDPFAPGSF